MLVAQGKGFALEKRVSRHPTLADVAAATGVSTGTVSKALNGRGRVHPETRARIQEAANKLGFQPNGLARGLLSGRTYTVGLITTDSFGRFSIPILMGAEEALGGNQISVLLCDGREDQFREQHHLETLLSRRVDGIIVTGRRVDPRRPIAENLPVPVVYVMAESLNPQDVSVIPDDKGGGALALRHLLATGRGRIGHITGPKNFQAARLRAAGACGALQEQGLPLAGGEVLWGEWSEEWGRQALTILLRSDPETDAIFCGSDQIARGAADALRDMGLGVPRDVALVGFDNWSVMAEASRPPLTTVDMNLSELGRYAAAKLLDLVRGEAASGPHVRPCSLVVRASTASS